MADILFDEEENGFVVPSILDHVPFINPDDYGVTTITVLNPKNCFITSGDAVVKAEYLERELRRSAATAGKTLANSKSKRHQTFIVKLRDAAKMAKALVAKLKKIRGDAIFLEMTWENRKLIMKPKNPRNKDDI